ncbi:hypothetical protein [Tunicatimonas pelagia]|uniref:hypothetical protein n=1 Tax=Tunicatimonas pelagia TaxID=931531 RepID=UPI0026653B46|nr:hypothetical protein [Tunicatimonas pelagia]WKN43150.1 hypothetical protein P0M28_29345 [Tunicatimonas pelagia]
MKYLYFLLAGVAFLYCSCEEEGSTPSLPSSSVASDLPLLRKGKHLGTIVGFNPSHPPATTDSIEARWQEALQAGMSVGRLQIDWPELEPKAGVYDREALRKQLVDLENEGLQTFLLISVYDSDGPVVPEYLAGTPMNDAELINSFVELMDWVIPMLVEHQGWAIAISNEPDTFFKEKPQLVDELLPFVRESRNHIHQLNDKMAVTITMSAGSLAQNEEAMRRLGNELDIISFNTYGSGLFPMNRPYSEEEILSNINAMLSFAGNKNMLFQEVGMHTNQPILNSSEEIQRTFFRTFFRAMQNEPQMRVAYVFQLVDWSPETIEVFNTLYEPSTPQSFIDEYSAVLASIGLIHYESGQRKAAWNEFVRWVETFKQTR